VPAGAGTEAAEAMAATAASRGRILMLIIVKEGDLDDRLLRQREVGKKKISTI